MIPEIDSSALPVVHIIYPESMTEADVDVYAQQLDALFKQGAIATVVDIQRMRSGQVGAADRKYLAAAMDRLSQANPGRLLAEAIVSDSAILRGFYTAYCWIRQDRSYPSRAFANMQAARAWIESMLPSKVP